MKQFKIDDITISLEDELVKELIEHMVLDDETTDPEDWEKNNYLYFRSVIRASFTHSLEDFGEISLEKIHKDYTDKEISKAIRGILIDNLKIYGGSWEE